MRVEFSEAIERRFSGLEIAAPGGSRVGVGRAQIQGKVIAVPIANPLSPGAYRVNWHILSVDGHKTQGSFMFEVRP